MKLFFLISTGGFGFLHCWFNNECLAFLILKNAAHRFSNSHRKILMFFSNSVPEMCSPNLISRLYISLAYSISFWLKNLESRDSCICFLVEYMYLHQETLMIFVSFRKNYLLDCVDTTLRQILFV